MKKIMIIILIVACVCAIFLALGVYIFGSAFNDTVSERWQHALGTALMWTFIVATITIFLVLWKPGFLEKDGIRITIGLIGTVAALVIASSPFTIVLTKLDREAKSVKQQRAEQVGSELLATVQDRIQTKKQLPSVEVKDFLEQANTVLRYNEVEFGLTGWQQLLEAKLVDPNMDIETTFFQKPSGKKIAGAQPVLNYTLPMYDERFGKILLQYGSDPNKIDKVEGNTTLIELAQNGDFENRPEKINLILSCGADVSIKNHEGKTALEILEERRKKIEQDLNIEVLAERARQGLGRIDQEIEMIRVAKNNPVKVGVCRR